MRKASGRETSCMRGFIEDRSHGRAQVLIGVDGLIFLKLSVGRAGVADGVMPEVVPTIVHLDADAFFVSVGRAWQPEYRGKKVAVGGRERGIIASASYEARAAGVYTPMPTARALRVCPDLILLPH